MTNIDDEMTKIQQQIGLLYNERNKLLDQKEAEEKAAKKLARESKSKEQLDLVNLREDIKTKITLFNELAKTSSINASVGLLTKGGANIYTVDENFETDDGEYFGEEDYYFNEFGLKSWFPSSISC